MAIYNGREVDILAVVHNDYPQVKVLPRQGDGNPEIVRLDHLELTEEEAKMYDEQSRLKLNIRKDEKVKEEPKKSK